MLTAGARLGPYEIVAPLGAGAMGEVHKARDTRLDRTVAIKILPASVADDPQRRERFRREARAISSLTHPHICALHDIGEQDGVDFLVMEYLAGETLAHRLLRGALPLQNALQIGVQLAGALEAAHRQGLTHRDLKPANVMLTSTGARVLDFGLAKWRGGDAGDALPCSVANVHPTLTQAGALVGTIQYMAPEQVEGKPVDGRSDLFALGAILYEMTTGRKAFDGASSTGVMAAILRDEPPGFGEAESKIPPVVQHIVRRCLQKQPEERFQSASDLAFALEAISGLSTTSVSAMPAARWTSRLRWVVIAAAALAAAVGAGLIIGARVLKNAPPALTTFTPLTFRSGVVHNARFAPDRQTIVYGAAWDGKPYEIFTTRGDLVESRSLGLPSASVLAISSAGEMAILLNCDLTFDFVFEPCEGTLARVPLVGGSPRPLVEHAGQADWSPDGKRLVVTVHDPGGGYRLESPIGTVLYRTSEDGNGIFYPRFSPTGDRIAFWQRGSNGGPAIVDFAGHRTMLGGGFNIPLGLSWSPAGDEIWFSGLKSGGGPVGWAIYGITPSGHQRVVWRADGQLQLHDVSRDGRVVMSRLRGIKAMAGVIGADTNERDLSWTQWSGVGDLSADGTTLLFEDLLYGVGGPYRVYLVRLDGSAPIKLADGRAHTLSRDGKWAIAILSNELRIVPTGPGDSRALPKGSLASYDRASWLPDQKRIVFSAKERGHAFRCYVQDVAGGLPRPITPEGVEATKWNLLVSRDGRYVAARDPAGMVALYPIEGGPPRAIPGIVAGDDAIQWSEDGRFLYVRAVDDSPAKVYRLDLTTGHRDLWKAISPQDPAGVRGVGKVSMTPDASTYVYSYWRSLNELFLVEGIK